MATTPGILGLENSMDRGAWQATVRGVTKSWTQPSDTHSVVPALVRVHCTYLTLSFISGDLTRC